MPTDWNQIAADAATATDNQFASQISSLSKFNDQDIQELINDTGISKENLAEVLKAVKDASSSNQSKANAIKNISKGVDVLVGIAAKFI